MSEVERYLADREHSMHCHVKCIADLRLRQQMVESCLALMRAEHARGAIEKASILRVFVPNADLVEAGKYLGNYLTQLKAAEAHTLSLPFAKS